MWPLVYRREVFVLFLLVYINDLGAQNIAQHVNFHGDSWESVDLQNILASSDLAKLP